MKGTSVAIAILLLASTTVSAFGQKGGIPDPNAPISQSKAAAIRKLLDLMGSSKLGKQIFDQLFATIKNSASQVPANVWDEIKKEFDADIDGGIFIENLVPIYNRAFTEDEVKELVRFYESPIGRKLTSALPQIAAEAVAAGQAWGTEVMKRIQKKLKDKGYSVSA